MRGVMVLGAATVLALAAGPAHARCAGELEAVMAEAPEIADLPPDQQLLARETMRDLRSAAHRLNGDGLELACLATVDALAEVMTDYHLAVDEPAPSGTVQGGEDIEETDAALDARDPRLLPLTAADMAFATRDVIGNAVYNYQGEEVGEFAGLRTGRGGVTHALIEPTDFWSISDDSAAVPVDLVRWDPQHALFYVPLNAEQLQKAPAYASAEGAWDPEMNDRYYAGVD